MSGRDPAADARTIAARQIRPHTAGRCGAVLEQICASQPPPCCALPAGHAGWHKDGPTEWTPDGLGVGIGRSEPGESADTGQETASPATVGAEQPPGVHQDTPDPWRLDLDAIETRANAACPGPWDAYNANEGTTSMPSWEVANNAYHNPSSDDDEPWIAVHVETGRREDAEFIAHARQDVPALIAEVRALRAAADQRQAIVDAAIAYVAATRTVLGSVGTAYAALAAAVDQHQEAQQ